MILTHHDNRTFQRLRLWETSEAEAHHVHESSLEPYLQKYKTGKDAYVQWGKILIPDNESAVERGKHFSKTLRLSSRDWERRSSNIEGC